MEGVGTVVNVISDNYGFAGKEFINLIVKLKDSLKKDFNSIITLLGSDKNYTKQSNALAIILLADGIVSKMIFEDAPLTLNDAKCYLRQDIDEAERYYNIILDYANSNTNKFYDGKNPLSGEVWGKIARTNGEIESFNFIPQKLYDLLDSKGISWNGVKEKLATKGYIQKSNDRGYAITQKLNGTSTRLIRVKNIYKGKDK